MMQRFFFFFQAEDGIRDSSVTGVQTCALPISKVNGTAVYGIDVRPPGVKIATLAQSPVFGGRLRRVDDAAARAVNGVRQIVRLDDAVAVVADHMGAAKKRLAALGGEWGDGPYARLTPGALSGE